MKSQHASIKIAKNRERMRPISGRPFRRIKDFPVYSMSVANSLEHNHSFGFGGLVFTHPGLIPQCVNTKPPKLNDAVPWQVF